MSFKYFIKPIPKEALRVDCSFPKPQCKNKGSWNINNGVAIYCDKHLLMMMKEKEASYLIVNKSMKSLLQQIEKEKEE